MTTVRRTCRDAGGLSSILADGVMAGVAPALGRDHVLADPRSGRPLGRAWSADGAKDLGDDRLELGEHGDPALAAALGDVGADVNPAGTLEVAALQAAQLGAADPGADAEVADPLLARRPAAARKAMTSARVRR
jgi:hypothetical protein